MALGGFPFPGRMAPGSYELTFGDERQTQSTVRGSNPDVLGHGWFGGKPWGLALLVAQKCIEIHFLND